MCVCARVCVLLFPQIFQNGLHAHTVLKIEICE